MSWEEVRLEDITLKIASGSTPTGGKDNYKESGISLIRSLNVHNFKFLYKDLAFIDITQSKKLSNVIVKRDDILLNITGASVGRCTIVPENILPARVNQHVMIIRANNEIVNSNFLLYLINSKQYKSKLLMLSETGATREALTKDDISNFKIKLPSLKIQNKIANILSNYDNLIENNNKRIKLLENMAEELYKEWFVRLRFPNYQNTKIVDGIPDEWKNLKIDNICTVGRGSSPRPISDIRYFKEGTIPWLKIADATASFIYVYKTKEYVNEYGASFSRKLKENSIIIAASGTLGFPMFLATECCIHDGWMYFDNIEDEIKIYFYYSLIYLKDYFNNQSYGAAIQNINTDIVKNSSILFPSKKIINNFNQIVKPMFDEIKILQLKNQNLKETRDLLLPRLISGKLDIKDLHIV